MSDNPNVPEIDVQEAKKRIDNGSLLLDVREQDEFDELRIPNSQLLPLSEFMQRHAAELSKDKEIVVYCRSGARSARATQFLKEQGYHAVNVEGGILAWKRAELPTESRQP